jgi:hypothetical protein
MYRLNALYQPTRLFFGLLIVGCVSTTLQAATQFDSGFESGLSGVSCSGNCPTITTNPVETGKNASNFLLTPSMNTSYRTEGVLGTKGKFQFGKQYQIDFDYRYQDWASDSDTDIAPFQIHNTPSSWSSSCAGGAVGYAPFLMTTRSDQASFVIYGDKVLWKGPVQKSQWIHLTVNFKISTGSDGFVDLWKDGVKVGSFKGQTSAKTDFCGKALGIPYFKMGVYKASWKNGRGTDVSRRQMVIDNLVITAF